MSIEIFTNLKKAAPDSPVPPKNYEVVRPWEGDADKGGRIEVSYK